MTITEALLRKAMPNAGARLDAHLPYINDAMERGGITTPDRIAAFLAQLAHESGEYRYMEELASGEAYEGRTDLGNVYPGDGMRYKGHGPIQVTGRDNHRAAGIYLGIDAEATPNLLTRPEYGTASAVWFWTVGNRKIDLNLLADKGWFRTITRIINGGYNGLSDRRQYWDRNRALLGLPYINLDLEPASIKAFQAAHNLVPDGEAGSKTYAALAAANRAVEPAPAPPPRILRRGSKGEDVAELQRALGITADGDFGSKTDAAVRAFQASLGLIADGMVGPVTVRAMKQSATCMLEGL